MKLPFEKHKGIHPGLILAHELQKRGLVQRQFARSVDEHPQTFNAIAKGKRKLTPALSFKIDDALQLEQGTMLFMQTFYEIAEYNRQQELSGPKLSDQLRPGLFWDTDMEHIDWKLQSSAIIRRVYERGNTEEQQAVQAYYGNKLIQKALNLTNSPTNKLHTQK
jgi:plasmid maintenance system antidote protein VapI